MWRPYLNVFLDNVSVDGIDLSGLTWAEGSQLVWDHVNQKQNGWYVRLRNTNGQYKDITPRRWASLLSHGCVECCMGHRP